MKFKMDFITNSSSTSYILCAPEVILEEDMEKLLERFYEDDELLSEADIVNTSKEELRFTIEQLFAGGKLGEYDNPDLFEHIIDLAQEKKWIISEQETGSDCGIITVLSDNDIEKIQKIRGLI